VVEAAGVEQSLDIAEVAEVAEGSPTWSSLRNVQVPEAVGAAHTQTWNAAVELPQEREHWSGQLLEDMSPTRCGYAAGEESSGFRMVRSSAASCLAGGCGLNYPMVVCHDDRTGWNGCCSGYLHHETTGGGSLLAWSCRSSLYHVN
jgi:hypothetical protein